MKLLSGFVSLAILSATTVSSIPITRRDVDESLVPQFGFSAGVNPTGTGDCDGAVNGADGQPVKVPCSCPPDRATFIQSLNANVAAGHVVNNPSVPISFPEDNSTASQLARINSATVTLQNLNGPGQGCPVASTTFQAQAAAIDTTGPQVFGSILMARDSESAAPVIGPLGDILARDSESAPPVIGPLGDILARDSESAPPVIGPLGDILKARYSELASSPTPTLTASVVDPPKSTITAVNSSESTSSPGSTLTISAIDPLESVITAIDSESASSLAPTPTFTLRFPPVIEDTLKARDSESASFPTPTPTNSLLFPTFLKDILKIESASSPSPTPTLGLLFSPAEDIL